MALRNDTLARMAQIAQEHGKSFGEVVAEMAKTHRYHSAIKALGFSENTRALKPYKHMFFPEGKVYTPTMSNVARATRYEGKTIAEISEQYGISKSTLMGRARRGAKTIKQLITPCGKGRGLHKTTLAKIAEIEREYGEPLPVIIKGFAADGVSFRAMCLTLNLTEHTLREYRQLFVPQGTQRKRLSNPLLREQTIARAVKVEGLRLSEIAVKFGVDDSTVRRRYHKHKPATIAELMKPYKRTQPKGNSDHWRGFNYRQKEQQTCN